MLTGTITITRHPMLTVANIENALRSALPPNQHSLVSDLAQLLADAISGELPPEQAHARLKTDLDLTAALQTLAGRQVSAGSSVISFGTGAQVGDVAIGDVAGRDVIKISLTYALNTSKGKPRGFLHRFFIVSGIMAFVVNFTALIEIVREIHFPERLNIPVPNLLPTLPTVEFGTVNVDLQWSNLTLLILFYIYIAYIALMYRTVLRLDNPRTIGTDVSLGELKGFDIVSKPVLALHFIILLTSLWFVAFSYGGEVSPYLAFHVVQLWLIPLLFFFLFRYCMTRKNDGEFNRKLEIRINKSPLFFVLLLPIWVFLELVFFNLTWWTSTLSVLWWGIVGPILYFLLLLAITFGVGVGLLRVIYYLYNEWHI